MTKTRSLSLGRPLSVLLALSYIFSTAFCVPTWAQSSTEGARFEIELTPSFKKPPLTGRVFLVLSHASEPDPIFQPEGYKRQMFAVAVNRLAPGQSAIIDTTTLGSPRKRLESLPPGDYYAQAYLKPYVEYHRADGHVLLALDQWDGQDGPRSAGVVTSKVSPVHLGSGLAGSVRLELTQLVPTAVQPADSEWVHHVKIKSELLSRFWGRPIYLGATVVLPKGYSAHPGLRYPVIYEPRNHYRRDGPFGFVTERSAISDHDKSAHEQGYEDGYEFYQSWAGAEFPRMIAVTLINPTPFYDLSGVQNSDNNGPYDDAIMQELIPYIESKFRTIREPWARVLVGKSSGGRDALALQLHHPEFFSGAWVFYPWSFDYARYFSLNVYEDDNAFLTSYKDIAAMDDPDLVPRHERTYVRSLEGLPIWTFRDWVQMELVDGGPTGAGAEVFGSDNALNSPVGNDGYPKHLYDLQTGEIDLQVAKYWRKHDLLVYAQDNWPRIGPHLVGKLHFYVGDADEWYRNNGIHHLQAFLETTRDPYYAGSFVYTPRQGHQYQPMPNATLVKSVAQYVADHAPKDADITWKTQ